MTLHCPPSGGKECRIATINAPDLYIKPYPCWNATPEAIAALHPIKPCAKFQYHLGMKSRGDCSRYGVEADSSQCWIQIESMLPDATQPIVGWIRFADTTTGPAPAGDVCGPARVLQDGTRTIYVGECSNQECAGMPSCADSSNCPTF
jgi:hypothetical protein